MAAFLFLKFKIMKLFFVQSLEYTFHFNNKIIEALLEINTPHLKSIKLINHIVNSHQIWNSRIENKSHSIDVWGISPLQDLKTINEMNYYNSLTIISNCGFDEQITYTNTKGQTFNNSIHDILFHAVNHSTYHRGHIFTDLKNNDIVPLVTDYIFYKRLEV